MRRLKDLLAEKGNDIWSVKPANSVYEAIEMMAFKGVGALTVLDESSKLVGIISERDYARKVILQGKSSKDTRVSEIMTKNVFTVQEQAKVDQCMTLMTRKRVRHLPVVKDEQVIGMISVGDLVKSIISEQDFKIEQLERYVRGEEAGSIH